MPKIEVCLTPALLDLYTIENSIVVVIDILRATSSITYGIDNGAESNYSRNERGGLLELCG
jgi:2-phosphosulfolactate phosphatase